MEIFLKAYSGDGPEPAGRHIPANDAKDFIKKYIEQATDKVFGLQGEQGVNAAIAFDRNSLNRVLKQPKCSGLRFYFGIEPSERGLDALVIIMVGVDKKGNDIGFDAKGEPLINLEAEETGTKTKSVLPKTLTNTNRALLLEYALK